MKTYASVLPSKRSLRPYKYYQKAAIIKNKKRPKLPVTVIDVRRDIPSVLKELVKKTIKEWAVECKIPIVGVEKEEHDDLYEAACSRFRNLVKCVRNAGEAILIVGSPYFYAGAANRNDYVTDLYIDWDISSQCAREGFKPKRVYTIKVADRKLRACELFKEVERELLNVLREIWKAG